MLILSPIGGAGAQFFDNDGVPLAGGQLYAYEAGTTTPLSTYTTSAGIVAHANPITLDAAGRIPGGQIWLLGSSYKFVLKDAGNTTIATWDNIENADATGIPFTAPVGGNFGATTDLVSEALTDLDTAITDNLLLSAPPGAMLMYPGSSSPTGWLLCDGSVVSAATYPDLYAVIAGTFNTGAEGAGNFRLPDLRGRVPIGVGTGTGLTARTLGATGGEETHQLTVDEMPAHSHGFSIPDHTHTEYVMGNDGSVTTGAAIGTDAYNVASNTGAAGAYSGSTVEVGQGGAHNNMQPFLALNFIIRT